MPKLSPVLLAVALIPACTDSGPVASTSDGDSTSGSTGDDGSTSVTPTTNDPTTDESSGDPSEGSTSTGDPTEGESGETGGCPTDCDDGVACTEDACVDGECVNTPVDTACDDGIECTSEVCDAQLGCVPTGDDTMCDDGLECTVDSCDVRLGCVGTPDDTQCDDGVECTVDSCDTVMGCIAAPDDTQCDDGVECTVDTCDAVMGCGTVADDTLCDDGSACTVDVCDAVEGCGITPTSVLVLNGSNGASTAPEDAVSSFGYTPVVTTDFTAFDAGYDAGGFVAIVWDVPSISGVIPDSTATRLDEWVSGGGRLIFGFWDLDTNPNIAATLGVTVVASTSVTLPILPDPASSVDLFDALETFPSPLVYEDIWSDNGDSLALAGDGEIAARFSDAMSGGGAILLTHEDRVVTNGFMATEIAEAGVDADMDSILDGEELLRNEIDLVCAQP